MAPAPSVQDLIGAVLHDAPDESPLTRLQTAASMMKAVTETTDAALGYFVDQARRAGHTWSEIGDSLGVSKQAAQQRHGGRLGGIPVTMERFTPRARRLLEHSEMAARHLGHAYIGTEHLLLAQYSEPEGLGAQVLIESGMSADAIRTGILDRTGQGSGAGEGRLPFTPRAVRVLTSALAVALELGHNYIGTEHLLLGTLRTDGVGAKLLEAAGLDEPTLKAKVSAKLAAITSRRQQPTANEATGKRTSKAPTSKAPGRVPKTAAPARRSERAP